MPMPTGLSRSVSIPTLHPSDFPLDRKRQEVLEDTLLKLSRNHEHYYQKAHDNHRRWQQQRIPPQKVVRVLAGDWGNVALSCSMMTGHIYAVLNMANADFPGGGYLEGMSAQEENMFRRTNCHYFRHEEEEEPRVPGNTQARYKSNMTDLINGKPGQVYFQKGQPRVCIKGFEGPDATGYEDLGDDRYFLFYELRSAADDLRGGKSFNEQSMRAKIHAQLETLRINNVRHVILSAFGCGAFENPANDVARLYKEELDKFQDCFDEVVFAIYQPNKQRNENYISFFNTLHNHPLISEKYADDASQEARSEKYADDAFKEAIKALSALRNTTTKKLYQTLDHAYTSFCQNKNAKTFDTFKQTSLDAIRATKEKLQQDERIQKILINIALAIAGLGVFYLVAATVHYMKNNRQHFFFYSNTKATEKEAVTQAEGYFSPQKAMAT